MQNNIVAAPQLAAEGKQKIEWVKRNMPILQQIEADFHREKYFAGLRILVCIHLEAKTAYLAQVFAAGGAEVAVTGSNPHSTKDDVVAALAADGLHVYARYGATPEEMQQYMNLALDLRPNIVIDDGGDLAELLHNERRELLADVWGACEETTTGVLRAKARAKAGQLEFPVVLINDARCKYLFDNYHGTGQSVWDGVMRTTNLVISGKTVVIIGYGWCGKGCAERAQGLGANVIICEIDPIKAADALMHGLRVMPLTEAAPQADIFLTVTGNKHVIRKEHFSKMKNGAIICNAGHFKIELDLEALNALALEKKAMRQNITGFRLEDGRWLNLLGDGDLVNIACADGHPAEIMDTSFALQALSGKHVALHHTDLSNDVHRVPDEIDEEVARLKLKGSGVSIDELLPEQIAYLENWEE
ncbi:MAG: adenosylhomocysteinase [SAR324 cluster bacterium]|nr:adenosylhomocysteinase [SAR324 cluster bacterium]